MWICYLLVPVLSKVQFKQGVNLLPVALFLSLVSFLIALWLLCQRSVSDKINGGCKLILDMVVAIALIWIVVQTDSLHTLLATVSH